MFLPLFVKLAPMKCPPHGTALQNEEDRSNCDCDTHKSCKNSMNADVTQLLEESLLSHVVTIIVKNDWNGVIEQSYRAKLIE